MTKCVIAAALIAGAVAVPAPAQDGVLEVETRIVLVDVVVRSDDGPVTDLTAGDFRIFDDGEERPVAAFDIMYADVTTSAARFPAGVLSNRADWGGQRPASATVILIDRLNTSLIDQMYVDYEIRQFFRRANAGDRLALYELSVEGLRVIRDYTADPQILFDAAVSLRPNEPLEVPAETGLEGEGLDPQLEAFASMGGFDIRAELDRLRAGIYRDFRIDTTTRAIQWIAHRMTDLPGRKSLVWISAGFPLVLHPHRHLDFAGLSYRLLDQIHETVVMLNEANVAVYPVHAPGLTMTHPRSADQIIGLAEVTGGQPFYNTNGFEEAIAESVEDTRTSYRLGFYPLDADDADFHRLDVRVDRPNVSVRHREGYFGFAASDALEPGPLMAELLVSPVQVSTLGLMGKMSARDADAGGYDVTVMVDLADLTLDLRDGFREGRVEIAMLYREELGSGDGELRILPPEEVWIRLTEAGYLDALERGFFIERVVETEGRPGRLRIGVREPSTGMAGSLEIPLGPPGFRD